MIFIIKINLKRFVATANKFILAKYIFPLLCIRNLIAFNDVISAIIMKKIIEVTDNKVFIKLKTF